MGRLCTPEAWATALRRTRPDSVVQPYIEPRLFDVVGDTVDRVLEASVGILPMLDEHVPARAFIGSRHPILSTSWAWWHGPVAPHHARSAPDMLTVDDILALARSHPFYRDRLQHVTGMEDCLPAGQAATLYHHIETVPWRERTLGRGIYFSASGGTSTAASPAVSSPTSWKTTVSAPCWLTTPARGWRAGAGHSRPQPLHQ